MTRVWAQATAICGTLDILYAIILTVAKGGTALSVLHSVASGPFGDAMKNGGWTTGLLGLAIHYAIMSVMVAVFVFLLWRSLWVRDNAILAGVLYGLLLYGVMYCVVLAARYPALFPQTDPVKIAISLFPHIFFVGIPLALMMRRAQLS